MSFQPNGVEFLDVSIEADFNKPHSPRINLKDMDKMSNGGKDEANQSTKKELSAIKKICMIAKLQCIFLPMKLFGLYYQDVRGTCSGEFVAYGGKSAFLMRSYQFVVIAILWMNFGKTLASFWVGNNLGTMILPAFLWFLQTALQASICFFTMNLRSRKSALKSLLLYWNSQPNFHELVVESYMIKCVKRTTMVAYLLMLMNTVLYGLILFSSESLIPVAQAMVSPLPVTSTAAKVFFFIVAIYSSAAWLMPFAIFSAVCLTLIHQCRRLRKTLRLTASASEVRRVKILRGQHSSLCGSVRKVDNLFKFLTLVVYVTNIPLLCFLFYNLIFVKTDNVLTKVTLSFWFIIVACIMIGVSFLGAQLNSWVSDEDLTGLRLFLLRCMPEHVIARVIDFTLLRDQRSFITEEGWVGFHREQRRGGGFSQRQKSIKGD